MFTLSLSSSPRIGSANFPVGMKVTLSPSNLPARLSPLLIEFPSLIAPTGIKLGLC